VKLSDVIEELVEERGLDRAVLGSIVCEGILAAYKKRYPDLILKAEHNKKTDEVDVLVEKKVVPTVEDEDSQISVRKARFVSEKLSEGDEVWLPFDGKIGRIEILRAKQFIATKIREIEARAIYDEFKSKEGTIVYGIIHKCERKGVVVKLQEALAYLPISLMVPTDKCVVGFPIRALLKEVFPELRNESQLVLDRVSNLFLQKLFELEIPEVFEKLVEIKKIVRSPGYKSKVVVVSHDKNIDPVGTCVGVGGTRIKPILKELGTEKIDIIAWSDSPETLIKGALKPAEVKRVEITPGQGARVWVAEDQRSLAIGKMGQNIALASKLLNMDIHLVQEDVSAQESIEQEKDREFDLLD
jgi:transcription termination/antitermination protein NusA